LNQGEEYHLAQSFSTFCCLCLNCHEEVLTLLFLLHCENGDFSVLMKDIV
jgi:hypothetical protein